jgi:cellulose synthase/poly-beta-1,6-N-acetylglucosamine synthase-like glycosyltransferase
MFSGVVIAIVCLPAILTFVWFSEVLAGCFALRKQRTAPVAAPGTLSHRTTVLMAAHNEGAGILPTIRNIQAQLGPNDRILVVADNCTDDTAAIVQAAGVEVIVRADPARRGKGCGSVNANEDWRHALIETSTGRLFFIQWSTVLVN